MSDKTYRLSPSKLSDFRDNPRGFWLAENHRLQRPRGIFPSLPGGVDRVLKGRADACRQAGGHLPLELNDLADRGLRLFHDQDKVNRLRQWNSAPKWTDPETGCSMIFAIDDLLSDSEHYVVPIDYKTKAGLPDEAYGAKYYGLQLDCYRLLLEEAAGFAVADRGVLAFYSPEGIEGREPGAVDVRFDIKCLELEVSAERAREFFREAVACLRGPLPMAGPREEWDGYALNYARKVTELSRAQAA